jgi:hypothetical protein
MRGFVGVEGGEASVFFLQFLNVSDLIKYQAAVVLASVIVGCWTMPIVRYT